MLCKLSKLRPDSIVLIPPAVLARTTHPRQWLVDLIEYHLWQLTHTVALVMYSFLEVYFMSFSSAGNADVFGLHIGLLLRHSCHSLLQECLWARRVEQTGIKDVGVFTGATTAPNPLHHQIPTVHSFQGKPLQSPMCSWNPSFLFWSVGCTLINLNFCSAEDSHKWMTSLMLIQLYLYSFLSENLRWHA